MAKLFERKSTTLTISEFYDNFKLDKYRFDVTYQRHSGVWSDDKKSFLIDSILKNYPIPAIFLRPCVNTETGKTVYDIVDGKQRLEAIIDFIENRVALTTYFSEDDFIDDVNLEGADAISGLDFSDIKKKSDKLSDYIKQFWTYSLNVEYLYEQKEELVASVFDRLNRNGEPLTRQELRNAKYADSYLLLSLKQLTNNPFWSDKLSRLKSVRMEDVEFISELFFLVTENKVLDSSQDILDSLYEKYKNDREMIDKTSLKVKEVIAYIVSLEMDFSINKRLCWTTHLYTLFSLAWKLNQKGIPAQRVRDSVESFFSEYFSKNTNYDGALKKYKDASSSRTRSDTQRRNRLAAILEYCKIQ
ncbi:MAG: DUF262 domain-containing protein [Clostridium sp.]|nr:DUF262 domain-containing protein [Clostridium sp.]